MKIAQFYDEDRIGLGFIEADSLIPIDFSGDMIDFMGSGNLNGYGRKRPMPLDRMRFPTPLIRSSEINAIGLNYKGHIEENILIRIVLNTFENQLSISKPQKI